MMGGIQHERVNGWVKNMEEGGWEGYNMKEGQWVGYKMEEGRGKGSRMWN